MFLERLFTVQAVQTEMVSGVGAILDQVLPGHFLQFPVLQNDGRLISIIGFSDEGGGVLQVLDDCGVIQIFETTDYFIGFGE